MSLRPLHVAAIGSPFSDGNESLGFTHLGNGNFADHRLSVRNERALIAWQRREQSQFHSLYGGFDAAQRVAA